MTSELEKRGYEITDAYTNPRNQKLFALSFIAALSINLINLLSFFLGYSDIVNFMGLIILMAFPTILTAVLFYNEMSAKSDYLRITTKGVEFKSTPVFPHGVLTKNGFVSFNRIKYVSLVFISSGVDISRYIEKQKDSTAFMSRPMLLAILTSSGKKIIIGERFPNKKLVQAVVLIETGAGLAQTWKKLSEKFPAMKEAVSDISGKVKQFFRKD